MFLSGIILAALYLFLAAFFELFTANSWIAIIYGIGTVMLPWFWLLPGTGFGIMAFKSKRRKQIIQTNLINHTNFGIGLFLWMIIFHGLFI